MFLAQVTPPSVEPIELEDAKTHCRVDDDITEDDTFLTSLISATRHSVEDFLRRALVTQTWDLFLECWPASREIRIPLPPLQSVTSITYTDEDGAEQTFSSSSYVVDTNSEPGRVLLKSSESWPSATLQPGNSIKIRFVAGYGVAADLDTRIRHAMLLMIGHYYRNREDSVDTRRNNVLAIPQNSEWLLWPLRNFF